MRTKINKEKRLSPNGAASKRSIIAGHQKGTEQKIGEKPLIILKGFPLTMYRAKRHLCNNYI
jgi:hypothetical protein